MVDFDETSLCLVEVGVEGIGRRLHVRTQVLLVLSIGLILDVLNLRTCGSCPFGLSILLSLFDAMGTIGSILILCEGRHGSIYTFIKGLYIWSDLVNLRCHVSVVVGV